MRKLLFDSIAVTHSLVINIFSIAKENSQTSVRHLIYQSGAQTVVGNNVSQSTQPLTCNFSGWLCCIKVNDTDTDGTISQSELDAFFATYDAEHEGGLDDEDEITNRLEKKFFGERRA